MVRIVEKEKLPAKWKMFIPFIKYQKADAMKPLPFIQRFEMTMLLISTLVPKMLYIILFAFISVLRFIFHLVLPKKMINLKDELAVVRTISQ